MHITINFSNLKYLKYYKNPIIVKETYYKSNRGGIGSYNMYNKYYVFNGLFKIKIFISTMLQIKKNGEHVSWEFISKKKLFKDY